MTITFSNTIKQGDATIIAAVREYFEEDIQKKVYENSISRNLPGAVTIKSNFAQGVSNKYEWTKSSGITTTDSTRYDIATNDLKLPSVEYATTKDYVEAEFKGGVVSEKEDIMMDQEAFVMGDIQESLISDLTTRENELFAAVVLAGTAVTGSATDVDLTVETVRYGVNQMRVATADQGKCRYIVWHPNMSQSMASFLSDASKAGDNRFLRENAIGMLHGASIVESTYITSGKVVYLGDDSVVLFERKPYTLAVSQDQVDDLYYKFAIKARFGMKIKRANRCLVGTFAVETIS